MSEDTMQRVLQRARELRYRRSVAHPTAEGEYTNRSCGDRLRFMMCVIDGKITDIAFQGSGCLLSQIAADTVAEAVVQGPIAQCDKLSEEVIFDLLGIALGPNRRACVTVVLEALRRAVAAGTPG